MVGKSTVVRALWCQLCPVSLVGSPPRTPHHSQLTLCSLHCPTLLAASAGSRKQIQAEHGDMLT